MLTFEDITYYLQWNARNEHFQKSFFSPNPECKDPNCLERQAEHKKAGKNFKESRDAVIKAARDAKKQTQNSIKEETKAEAEKWGFEIVDEDASDMKMGEEIKKEEIVDSNVDDLAAQLRAMNM